MALSEHDAEDQALTAAMHGLIDLWNKRRFSSLGDVASFRAAVRALDVRVNGAADAAPPPPPPPRSLKAEGVLTRMRIRGSAFRAEAGAVTVTSSTDGKRDALIGKPDALGLARGAPLPRHPRRHVPARVAALSIAPGDELVARLKYKAEGEASLAVSLRSLDDPEGAESTETWRAASGDKAVHEVKLTADPQQSGFYLGLAVKGSPVEIGALELLRGGNVLVAAKPGEPTTRTDCTLGKPVVGGAAHPLRCVPGEGDRVTLAQPQGYLIVTVRDASGPRASLKALSLEGGAAWMRPWARTRRLSSPWSGPGPPRSSASRLPTSGSDGGPGGYSPLTRRSGTSLSRGWRLPALSGSTGAMAMASPTARDTSAGVASGETQGSWRREVAEGGIQRRLLVMRTTGRPASRRPPAPGGRHRAAPEAD